MKNRFSVDVIMTSFLNFKVISKGSNSAQKETTLCKGKQLCCARLWHKRQRSSCLSHTGIEHSVWIFHVLRINWCKLVWPKLGMGYVPLEQHHRYRDGAKRDMAAWCSHRQHQKVHHFIGIRQQPSYVSPYRYFWKFLCLTHQLCLTNCMCKNLI